MEKSNIVPDNREVDTGKKPLISPEGPFFVFDVESVGLHGEGFAVAGGVYIDSAAEEEFSFGCNPDLAQGDKDDLEWVKENVYAPVTHESPEEVREAFWSVWEGARRRHPGILMFGECLWPVEANFVSACIRQNLPDRKWKGPYPLHEIASFMLAAGMNPMAIYLRNAEEMPAHNPLADVRLSARLLASALAVLQKYPTRPFLGISD